MPLYPLPRRLKVVFFYNCVSFMLWLCCFLRFAILLPLVGRRFLPGGIADYFHVVSLTPLVGFVVVRLAMKRRVGSGDAWALANALRMAWVCYGVVFPHPRVAKHTSYSFLIASWCFAYIVHYSYHAFRTKTRASPRFLRWLHRNGYLVALPLAAGAEMVLSFLSLEFVDDGSWEELLIQGVLLAYVPGSYVYWRHLRVRAKGRIIPNSGGSNGPKSAINRI